MKILKATVVVGVLVTVVACGSSSPGGGTTVPPIAAPPRQVVPSGSSTHSAWLLCESFIGRDQLTHARLDRAVPTTVGTVKSWVTAPWFDGTRIAWDRFSKPLVDAPLTDRVAVCDFFILHGLFTAPQGSGDPIEPTQALITIAQFSGRQTLYQFGDRVDMQTALENRFGPGN